MSVIEFVIWIYDWYLFIGFFIGFAQISRADGIVPIWDLVGLMALSVIMWPSKIILMVCGDKL